LQTILAALKQPVFTPFAGRKAHPLTLPMAPQLIPSDLIDGAFAAFDTNETSLIREMKSQTRSKLQAGDLIYTDLSAIPVHQRDVRISRYEERRDLPESRAKWRFGLRSEALLRDPPPKEVKP
jgi:CRISPR system Cascade subunit CasD